MTTFGLAISILEEREFKDGKEAVAIFSKETGKDLFIFREETEKYIRRMTRHLKMQFNIESITEIKSKEAVLDFLKQGVVNDKIKLF